MLKDLSREIRECNEHAEDCARKAETATNDDLRADFFRLEQSWLKLARSYELGERLTAFTKRSQATTQKTGKRTNVRGDAHANQALSFRAAV